MALEKQRNIYLKIELKDLIQISFIFSKKEGTVLYYNVPTYFIDHFIYADCRIKSKWFYIMPNS